MDAYAYEQIFGEDGQVEPPRPTCATCANFRRVEMDGDAPDIWVCDTGCLVQACADDEACSGYEERP